MISLPRTSDIPPADDTFWATVASDRIARPPRAATAIAHTARLVATPAVRWVDCSPEARPRIYFANHSSHLDFPVLWSCLPPAVQARTRPVAARDYWDAGALRRRCARLFNLLLIDRHPNGRGAGSLAAMVAALDSGSSLILFPEGTRGDGDAVRPFHAGLYTLALRRPSVELVPVRLDGLARVLPRGHAIPVPLGSSVTFGPPVQLVKGESKGAFLARARAAVAGPEVDDER